MNAKTTKQVLKSWIDDVDDPSVLSGLKLFKENIEAPAIKWNELPEAVKKGIKRGQEDVKEGRVISNEEFWQKYEQRL